MKGSQAVLWISAIYQSILSLDKSIFLVVLDVVLQHNLRMPYGLVLCIVKPITWAQQSFGHHQYAD